MDVARELENATAIDMLYAIWTIRNETVFKVRHEYTKAAVVRRFIFLWNSAMRRAWPLHFAA